MGGYRFFFYIMIFYFYEEAMKEVAKISVDGLAPNSFHLSHWEENKTPLPLKADTATEIALRYLCHPDRREFFPQVRIITNNHFDTDGLLAIWTLLNPKKAEPMAGRLIAAAEAGDFSIFSSEEGVQVNLLIQALCHSPESPLKSNIESYSGPREAACYKELLPMISTLFWQKASYRSFWEPPFKKLLRSMDLFEKGLIGLEEYEEEGLSVVIADQLPAPEAIDHYCQGNLFLLIEDRQKEAGGFGYELLYRYYAWAETVTRPRIRKTPMETLAETLKLQEGDQGGVWMTDYPGQGMTSVLKCTNEMGESRLSSLHPEKVVDLVLSHLRSQKGEED